MTQERLRQLLNQQTQSESTRASPQTSMSHEQLLKPIKQRVVNALSVDTRRQRRPTSILNLASLKNLNQGGEKIVSYIELKEQRLMQRRLSKRPSKEYRPRNSQLSVSAHQQENNEWEQESNQQPLSSLMQKKEAMRNMSSIKRKKESDDSSEDEDTMYEKRNQDLYNMLRNYKVCVVPDSKIVTIDRLPNFSIIEANIKGRGHKGKTENTKKSKKRYENLNSLQNSTMFYQQLNQDAMTQMRKKPKEFYSESLNQKAKKIKTFGFGATGGMCSIDQIDKIERDIKEMYEKQIVEQQESEEINQLLGPIREEDVPKFSNLPPMKRLVMALKVQVAKKQQLKEANANKPEKKKTFHSVLEQYQKTKTFKKQKAQSQKRAKEPDNSDNESRQSQSRHRNKKNINIDQMPPDLRFFHKFKAIIRKQVREMVHNSVLENAYKTQKRKLEIDILRMNEKNKVTQVILNQIDSEEAQHPIPQYRYQAFKQKLKEMYKRRDAIKSSQSFSQMIADYNNVQNNLQQSTKQVLSFSVPQSPQLSLKESDSSSQCSDELLDNVFFDKQYESVQQPKKSSNNLNKRALFAQNRGMSVSVSQLFNDKFAISQKQIQLPPIEN